MAEMQDTFTMDDAESAVSTAVASEPPSSFSDAFNKAMGGDTEKPEEPKKAEEPAQEAEPEPEKAEAPEPADTEPDKKESRSAKDFKLVKQKAKEAEGEVAKLRAEIEALKSQTPEGNDELDALKRERDELSDRLKAAALEKHPKFENYYRSKIDGIISRAKSLVGEEMSDRVESLLNMGGGAERNSGLEDIFSELGVTQQAQMGALLTQMDEVLNERSSQLQNASQTYEAMEQNQTQQREAFLAESERTFDRVGEDAKAWGVFQEREGDAEWNAALAERTAIAKQIYMGESDPEQLARAAYMASSADFLNELLTKEVEAHRLTKSQLTELQGANPSVSASASGASTGESEDFLSAYKKAMGQG